MKRGITFSTFDLFHAGHILMLQEAKTRCDWLIACIQTDPTIDRPEKNKPLQSIFERYIQVKGCILVDETLVYETEADLLLILKSIQYDVWIIGEEYKDKEFTGRDISLDKCYFNRRQHSFSTTELRNRIKKESESFIHLC